MDINEQLRADFVALCKQVELEETEDLILADMLPSDRSDNYFLQTPSKPTLHQPGSPGKIAVLAERAQANLALWHPDDAPLVNEKNLWAGTNPMG